MNYYKQGNAANADKIRAAFEKLGYDTSRHLFNAKSVLYFTLDGEIRATTCNCTPAIIKTHPDYKELELPVEPKFKVGDWIVQNDNGTVSQITKITNGKDEYGEYHAYRHTNGYFAACVENEYHLWTIKDAKDGDVLVCYSEAKGSPIEQAGIFKQYVGRHGGCSNTFLAHTGIDWDGNIIINGYMGSTNILPATKEQRNLFFKKMREAGYQWDADKKELKKIQSHYDIANFKPFDKVLVRDAKHGNWNVNLFSHYIGDIDARIVARFRCITSTWIQCIPFEGNESLLGTTDMCPKEYINW